MRRVDWPDKEGWWWVVKPKRHGATEPMKFIKSYDRIVAVDRILPTSSGTATAWGYMFEGPIPEPRAPQRFEITATPTRVDVYNEYPPEKRKITIGNIMGRIPEEGIRATPYRVTFEEILCEE